MKKFIIVFCFFIMSFQYIAAQKHTVWITYGYANLLYSPGFDASIHLKNRLSVHAGVNAYFHFIKSEQIVNRFDSYSFNFYNSNIGLSYNIFKKTDHTAGITTGLKIYYGPEYNVLHYYRAGGYYIYFNSAALKPDFGIDFGIFYSFKRLSTILKFDTARNMFRVGFGLTFGK